MRAHDDRRLDQVAAVLREDRALARLPHAVAGAPDALQPAAHGAGRLDLDHQIDGAHVDAELERRGGHDRPERAALQLVFDDDPLLTSERAVVGLDQLLGHQAGLGVDADALFLGELVQFGRQTLGRAAGVAEDDRRPV